MKLISKVTAIYCIADDFCKECELELNKKALPLSNSSPNTPKTRNRKGRMSDAEMITLLVLFHSNTFRNFKYVYLFYVCQELKEEYADKGYISQSLFASLFDRVVHIITGIRTNMKNRLMEAYDKIMLRKRIIIETINDMLKNVAQIIHTATEVSQTLLSTFLQKWRLMLSTIQNLLSIWSLRWREKQR